MTYARSLLLILVLTFGLLAIPAIAPTDFGEVDVPVVGVVDLDVADLGPEPAEASHRHCHTWGTNLSTGQRSCMRWHWHCYGPSWNGAYWWWLATGHRC